MEAGPQDNHPRFDRTARRLANVRGLRAALALLAACWMACSAPLPADDVPDMAVEPDGSSPPPTLRVLFIGNSYTSVNDLPNVVSTLSQTPLSPVRIAVEQHTPGGQTWEGHNADPKVAELIARGWDYVVLQDQSDQPWVSTSSVKASLRSLDAKIKAVGAKTVLYMTWPKQKGVITTSAQRFSQDMLANLYYEKHAEAVGASVGIVKRQTTKPASPKDDLDKLMDDLDALGL